MIQQIDAVGSAESPFKFSFFGLRETRSLKLQSLIEQAFETQLNLDSEKTAPCPRSANADTYLTDGGRCES